MEKQDLAPKLILTACFSLVSYPVPSLINNCWNSGKVMEAESRLLLGDRERPYTQELHRALHGITTQEGPRHSKGVREWPAPRRNYTQSPRTNLELLPQERRTCHENTHRHLPHSQHPSSSFWGPPASELVSEGG